MKKYFYILLLSCISAHADYTGFIKIRANKELFVEYKTPSKGAPTVVLLNGLTYSTKTWNSFVHYFDGSDLGILRYDAIGQGETLLKYAPVAEIIPYREQIEDLHLLFDHLQLTQGNITLVGLSYGGALATAFTSLYPQYISQTIAMAPYVAALPMQDGWIKQQISFTRQAYPYNPATDDQLYDYYLRVLVYSTYPSAEPSVLENPFKLEAVYRMTQGIRKYDAKKFVSHLPMHGFHLVVAEADQYIDRKIHEEHWQSIPVQSRASCLFIKYSEHKIPEAYPKFAAEWIKKIISGEPDLFNGHTFEADPLTGQIIQTQ